MADRPRRIQLKRTRGWRKPTGVISVCRPSVFGNPFTFSAAEGSGQTRQGAVLAFRDWLSGNPWACGTDLYEAKRLAILSRLYELRGRDLACWCPLDTPCHADVLIDLANRPEPEDASHAG